MLEKLKKVKNVIIVLGFKVFEKEERGRYEENKGCNETTGERERRSG
jgi:hypothetical protein